MSAGHATTTAGTTTAGSGRSIMTAPDCATILERIDALVPTIRQSRRRIEAARELPKDVVDQLRRTGTFGAAVERERGGSDLDSVGQLRLVEALAEADPSVGWCAMIGMDSGIYAGYLHPEAVAELYPDAARITAGWVAPAGRARRVDGGYVISGHWRFGSGCTHADVIVAGCVVEATGEWRIAAAPADRFVIERTWDTTGLAGSGSHDYHASELFVPERHTFTFATPVLDRTLDRRSDAILRKMPGVPLGVAQAAIAYLADLAEGDVGSGSSAKPRHHLTSVLGRSAATVRAARSYVYETVEATWAALTDDPHLATDLRVDGALARWNAFRAAREVLNELYDTVGGDAAFEDRHPLGQWVRDTTTMCQHVVAQARVPEWCGQMMLGIEPGEPFV